MSETRPTNKHMNAPTSEGAWRRQRRSLFAREGKPMKHLRSILPRIAGCSRAAALGLALAVFSAGCVALPIPLPETKVLEGRPVKQEQLAFLTPTVTPKTQVLEKLGEPNVIWEEANLFGYYWTMRCGVIIWAAGGGYTADMGVIEIPKRYVFLIQFDQKDRVRRFEKVAHPVFTADGEFLRQWIATTNIIRCQHPTDGKE